MESGYILFPLIQCMAGGMHKEQFQKTGHLDFLELHHFL